MKIKLIQPEPHLTIKLTPKEFNLIRNILGRTTQTMRERDLKLSSEDERVFDSVYKAMVKLDGKV